MEVVEEKYDRFSAYKDSGLASLGDIPAHWGLKRLKFLVNVLFSNVDKHTIEGEQPVRLVNYTDVYKNEVIHPEMDFMHASATENEIEKFLVEEGDVIVTKDSESPSDIAVPAYVKGSEEDMICGYHLSLLKPGPEVDGRFLMRCFQSGALGQQFEVAAKGVTRFAIGKGDIGNSLFPVPPLDEQQTIADWLDKETARVDALVEKKKRFIEVLKEKRAALISKAVTQGINPDAKMKDTGIPWLGQVPAHWEVKRLKFLASINPSKGELGNVEDGLEVSFLPMEKVSDHGTFDTENTSTYGQVKSGYTYFQDGDVVMAKITPCFENGKCVVVDKLVNGVGFGSSEFHVMRPGTEILPRFLFFLTRSSGFIHEGRSWMYGVGGLVRIPTGFFDYISVVTPPLDEQQEIVEWIDGQTERMDELIQRSEAVIEKMHEYRRAIISAAVTGKIKVS